jgi:hypothetical protein
LGGVATAAFGGSTPAVNTGGTSTSSGGNAQVPNNINLKIELHGGRMDDPGTIAVITKGIKSFVTQNNGQLVATEVVGA